MNLTYEIPCKAQRVNKIIDFNENIIFLFITNKEGKYEYLQINKATKQISTVILQVSNL